MEKIKYFFFYSKTPPETERIKKNLYIRRIYKIICLELGRQEQHNDYKRIDIMEGYPVKNTKNNTKNNTKKQH